MGEGDSRTNIPERLTWMVLWSFAGIYGEDGSLLRFLLVDAEMARRRSATEASPTCCHQQLKSKFQKWSDTSNCLCAYLSSQEADSCSKLDAVAYPGTQKYTFHFCRPERIAMSSQNHAKSQTRAIKNICTVKESLNLKVFII